MSRITLEQGLHVGVTKRVSDLGPGPMAFTGRIMNSEGLWFLSHIGVTRLAPESTSGLATGGTGWETSYMRDHCRGLEVEDFREVDITIKIGQ